VALHDDELHALCFALHVDSQLPPGAVFASGSWQMDAQVATL
jgi:hypothetical protein